MYLYEATNQDFDWTLVTCRCHIFSMSTYHIQGTRSVKRSSNWRGSAPTSIHSLMSWFLCATRSLRDMFFQPDVYNAAKKKQYIYNMYTYIYIVQNNYTVSVTVTSRCCNNKTLGPIHLDTHCRETIQDQYALHTIYYMLFAIDDRLLIYTYIYIHYTVLKTIYYKLYSLLSTLPSSLRSFTAGAAHMNQEASGQVFTLLQAIIPIYTWYYTWSETITWSKNQTHVKVWPSTPFLQYA